MDLFDPKPVLTEHHGKPYPGSLEIHFDKQAGKLLASPFRFRPHGQSGMVLSELLPHISGIVDDVTLVRSMTTESVDHEAALRLIHTGKVLAGRPTWGSWVVYALGTREPELAGLRGVVRPRRPAGRRNSQLVERLAAGDRSGNAVPLGRRTPVLNLKTPHGSHGRGPRVPASLPQRAEPVAQEASSGRLRARRTDRQLRDRRRDADGRARGARSLPGVGGTPGACTAWTTRPRANTRSRCLIARRLVERGVRFVQLFLSGQPWDTHNKNAETLKSLCAGSDQPSAALVRDLKQRGLLDETIVIWTGEFGRLPVSQGTDGRDHNRHGFSLWLAGGGFKAGYVHGATDDFGYKSVENIVTVHDLQATLLHALGLDHRKLTYPHEGRLDSLTDAEVTKAKVVPSCLREPSSTR